MNAIASAGLQHITITWLIVDISQLATECSPLQIVLNTHIKSCIRRKQRWPRRALDRPPLVPHKICLQSPRRVADHDRIAASSGKVINHPTSTKASRLIYVFNTFLRKTHLNNLYRNFLVIKHLKKTLKLFLKALLH